MKKEKGSKNYLEKIPAIPENFRYSVSDDGAVTIEIDNKGFMNRIFQLILKKPKVSYVHLDAFGSFAFLCANGTRDIAEIAVMVEDKFGDDAHPLYERLAKFFQILESYKFISWND